MVVAAIMNAYKLNPHYVYRLDNAEFACVFDHNNSSVMELNKDSCQILKLIKDGKDRQGILETLEQQFGSGQQESLENTLDSFLDYLLELKILLK